MSTMPKPSNLECGIQVSEHISTELGWHSVMLKPHVVMNGKDPAAVLITLVLEK